MGLKLEQAQQQAERSEVRVCLCEAQAALLAQLRNLPKNLTGKPSAASAARVSMSWIMPPFLGMIGRHSQGHPLDKVSRVRLGHHSFWGRIPGIFRMPSL